jgi:hypothetical protein
MISVDLLLRLCPQSLCRRLHRLKSVSCGSQGSNPSIVGNRLDDMASWVPVAADEPRTIDCEATEIADGSCVA